MIALWDEADQWHEPAHAAYEQIKKARLPVVATSYVLLECANAAARRPYRPALKLWRDALALGNAIIEPTDEDRTQAWLAYDRREAGNAGIVDQVSFVVMRRLSIQQAFTNDEHFRAAGFETLF